MGCRQRQAGKQAYVSSGSEVTLVGYPSDAKKTNTYSETDRAANDHIATAG
jgi:hypothetical protein